MKSILLWYVVFGLLVLISCSREEKPTTIKSSQIHDGAVTEVKHTCDPVCSGATVIDNYREGNYISQKIMKLRDGLYCMNTWVYVDGMPEDLLIVYEESNPPKHLEGSSIWYVSDLTDEVKKAQWERAEKKLSEHLKKITPYK